MDPIVLFRRVTGREDWKGCMIFFESRTNKLFSSSSPPQVRKYFSVSAPLLLSYYCISSLWYKKLTSRVNETSQNFSAMSIALPKIENRQSVPTVPPQGLSEFRALTFTEATPRSAHSAPVLAEHNYCTFLVLFLKIEFVPRQFFSTKRTVEKARQNVEKWVFWLHSQTLALPCPNHSAFRV